MDETFVLPEEDTPVSLADEATETKCIIKSGERVMIGRNSFKMPDGTMRASIKDCKLEVGSSMVFEYTDDKKTDIVVSKPRKKIHEIVSIPVPLPDPSTLPTSTETYITENSYTQPLTPSKFSGIDPIAALLLGVAVISAIAIASIVNFANSKTAKIKKKLKSKINNLEQQQKKKQEEQKKCNSKSDNLKSLIEEVDLIIRYSNIHENKFEKNKDVIEHKLAKLNLEIHDLNKKINKLEDGLTKVKPKKTTYKKGYK